MVGVAALAAIFIFMLVFMVTLVILGVVIFIRQNRLKNGIEYVAAAASERMETMGDSVHDDLQQMADIISNLATATLLNNDDDDEGGLTR